MPLANPNNRFSQGNSPESKAPDLGRESLMSEFHHRSSPVFAYSLPLDLYPVAVPCTAQAQPCASPHAWPAQPSGVSTARACTNRRQPSRGRHERFAPPLIAEGGSPGLPLPPTRVPNRLISNILGSSPLQIASRMIPPPPPNAPQYRAFPSKKSPFLHNLPH